MHMYVYVYVYVYVNAKWQWGQVGWILADHRDGLSSASFWLDPR